MTQRTNGFSKNHQSMIDYLKTDLDRMVNSFEDLDKSKISSVEEAQNIEDHKREIIDLGLMIDELLGEK